MKKIKLFIILIAVTVYSQNEEVPFKYVGEGKWVTSTEFVRQYDKDLSAIEFYDSAYAELEKQNRIFSVIVDSLKSEINLYKKVIAVKDSIIGNKTLYIEELEKPHVVKSIKDENASAFIFDGFHLNFGTYYRFDSLTSLTGDILERLKYFGSVETGLRILDKFKLNIELIFPPEIRLKGGIKL